MFRHYILEMASFPVTFCCFPLPWVKGPEKNDPENTLRIRWCYEREEQI
jgi:hypothetical protein